MTRLRHRVECEVQQHEDRHQHQGNDDPQAFACPQLELVLARPRERVPGRQRDPCGQRRLRLLDVPAEVAGVGIDVHVARELPVLIADHRRAFTQRDARQLPEGHVRPARGLDEDALERRQVVAEGAIVAHAHGIALAALDRARHGHAAHRGLDDVLHVGHRQAVARNRVATDVDVGEVALRHALGIHAARAGHRLQRRLDPAADLLDHLQVGAEHLDADGGLDPREQHVEPVADRHGPRVGEPGELQLLVEFLLEAIERHPRTPLFARFQDDRRVHHPHRRVVGRGGRPSDAAEDALDLRHLRDEPILHLHQAGALGHRQSGRRGGHVEQRALVERRHELRADLPDERQGERDHEDVDEQGRPAPAQGEPQDGRVDRREEARQRVRVLGPDPPAAHEVRHQRRHERDGQQRREQHREGLGPRQRAEHPSLLRLEQEDGHERDDDDGQREEERPPDLLRGGHDLARLLVVRHGRAVGARFRQPAIGVVDHHDRRVDEFANRQRDARKRHDVRRHAEVVHRDERGDDGDRQRDDRDERRAHVEEEHEDHQRHDDDFLHERVAQGHDRVADEPRSVVGGHDAHAGRKRLLDVGEPLLDAVDHAEGVLAEPHHDDAADDLALAVEVGRPAAQVGAHADARDVLDAQRRPARVGADGNRLDVGDRLQVAASPHHVLAPGELEQAPLDVVVAALDGHHDVLDAEVDRGEALRVERHLVLLHEATDRRDLGDARHAGELVPQVPVLQRSEVGECAGAAVVDEGVLEHPADAGRIGAERRRHPLGEPRAQALQELDDTAARPVDVGAVLEDDVDVRDPEVGEPADGLHLRCRDQGRHDRIGDLVFDEVGAAALPLGRDDDLDVGDVGHGVERRLVHRPDAPEREAERGDDDDDALTSAPGDEAFDHGCLRSSVP